MTLKKELETLDDELQISRGDETKKKSFSRPQQPRPSKSLGDKSFKKRKKSIVIEAEVLDEDEISSHEQEEDESSLEVSFPKVELVDEEFHDEHQSDNIDDEISLSNDTGLTTSNALTRYLAEIRKYSLMTPAEEKQVALAAFEENSIEARNRLVTANLRLVVKIAMEYRRAYSQILDLIQEGNAGLVQAVNRFNPYRGVKLSTYSAWWIRAYILKFLMDNKSLVRMGTTDAQRKLFFRLRGEAEKMYALTQKFDANLLAEKIGVQPEDVIDMQQRLTKNDVSLDTPTSEDSESRQIDLLYAQGEDQSEILEKEQLLKILNRSLPDIEKELNERDLFIFKHRIMSDEPITLQEVGDKFSITRERARQLESRIMKKIKDKLIAVGIQR
ncbi:MAG: RNA polymerase factor sigma-32 [Silvanigrellaceae bacterium]|nr:RNA polymerase factor sigma-32 [Silvanigrellaceae bacterium]